MRWYNEILAFIQYAAPNLRATRTVNLALLSAAILSRRQLSLSALARAIACSGLTGSRAHRHSKKRLFRFLSNDLFDPLSVQTSIMPSILSAARLKGRTPIMIDWSDLGRGFNGLFAAVCFRKRGLPLLSWVSRPEELDHSQNRVEERFIRRLIVHLPDRIRPLILADRGFGRASLIKFLQDLPSVTGRRVDFVVRVRGDVWIKTAGFEGALKSYPLAKRSYALIPEARYRRDGAVVVNLVLYWGARHKEPWYLATTLSDAHLAVKMYRMRMQPEQYFRDGKQRFDLDAATVTTSRRLQRLLVGVLMACAILIVVGMKAPSTFRRQVCSWGRLGVLHLGLEFYLATDKPPLRYLGLPNPQSGYA